jgi:Nif-specific regulatory protein
VIEQNLPARDVPVASQKALRVLNSKNERYKRMLKLVEQFSVTDMPVLISGESGVGKDVIANYIYEMSRRNERPFVSINCAAIPETLLESELFGYEKGAFTGAQTKKNGKFDEANGGTLFLDEIGDMPFSLQAKMLRVLQDFAFYRLGGQKTIRVDTRIIAASNQNLHHLIETSKFREDLYHRLNGVHLKIPALRERPEDLEDLVRHFVGHYARKYHKTISDISDETLQILARYDWPGNIRELMNCLERAAVICEGSSILPEHLPDQIRTAQEIIPAAPNRLISQQTEDHKTAYLRKIILEALSKTHGNRSEAAKLLKISRKTLYNRMKELQISYDFK